MEKKYADKVMDLLHAMDDISELSMNPRIFDSNADIDMYDCDTCTASKSNLGDIWDEGVCLRCWEQSIRNC